MARFEQSKRAFLFYPGPIWSAATRRRFPVTPNSATNGLGEACRAWLTVIALRTS